MTDGRLARDVCDSAVCISEGKISLPPLAYQAYWRIAGMSYLKYSNLCAEVVRGSLKEPFLTKVVHPFNDQHVSFS